MKEIDASKQINEMLPEEQLVTNTNRRTFLQQFGASVGALGLLSTIEACASPEGTRKLGVALVGLGYYSEYLLAPALQQTKFCQLTGIVTGTPAKADKWATQFKIDKKNVYNYQNFDKIKDNEDIDIVYVVLPNSMHHEFTIRALKAGKHVICEKPMATTVKECEEMIATAKQVGKQLSIGYRLRFDPYNLEIARLTQNKALGNLTHIEANFGFAIGDPNQWRLNKKLSGGGALMDVGIYAVQGTRYGSGLEPIAATAQQYKTGNPKFKEVEETLLFQLEYPNGLVANCSTTYAFYIEKLKIFAERGFYELAPAYSYGGLQGRVADATKVTPISYQPFNQQAAQMDAFADCLLHNRPTTVSGEMGLQDMKILEAIYKAMETGQRVMI
jgi:predicted dehydrogenase